MPFDVKDSNGTVIHRLRCTRGMSHWPIKRLLSTQIQGMGIWTHWKTQMELVFFRPPYYGTLKILIQYFLIQYFVEEGRRDNPMDGTLWDSTMHLDWWKFDGTTCVVCLNLPLQTPRRPQGHGSTTSEESYPWSVHSLLWKLYSIGVGQSDVKVLSGTRLDGNSTRS